MQCSAQKEKESRLSFHSQVNGHIPKVSVVIPTYNRAAFVVKAIESVLCQTFKDYEIIVVDDGSTDDTRVRLERYINRIRYVYQANGGASSAQNVGVRESRGEWVAILADDDVWLPTKLERQFEAFAVFGEEFGVCFTNCLFSDGTNLNRTAFDEAGIETHLLFQQLNNPIEYILGRFGLYVQSMLVRRRLIEGVGGFDESLGIAEDRDLILRLSFRTKFCVVSLPLVQVDRDPGVSRLEELFFNKRNDLSCAWISASYRKMLGYPEIINHSLRETIHDTLISNYYAWAAERISRFRIKSAYHMVKELHIEGQSYSSIITNLFSRAVGKILRVTLILLHGGTRMM